MTKKDIISILLSTFVIGVFFGGLMVYTYHNTNFLRYDLKYGLSNSADAAAYLKFKEIRKEFTPSGIPNIYGQELAISFDDVQDAINKVSTLDPTYGSSALVLTGDDLKRYVIIGSQISCEHCCGAVTLVFENGEAACGCEHSQMMRGLAAYLILNHPDMSNEDILQELVLWKRTYFPKQTLSVYLEDKVEAGEPGIEEVLKEFPDFLPQMVGGC